MINLVTMLSGEGARFKNEGYNLPKPLIEIDGLPFFYISVMSYKAILKNLNLFFVIQRNHLINHQIDKKIESYFPNAKIIILDKIYNGPVLSANEAIKQIDNNNPIIFNDCDHHFISHKYLTFISSYKNDIDYSLIYFNSNNPNFSYVEINEYHEILRTKEKICISNNALSGSYFFKSKQLFLFSLKNYSIYNNYSELYFSGMYNSRIKNSSSKAFAIDKHFSFGTPNELKELLKNREFIKCLERIYDK